MIMDVTPYLMARPESKLSVELMQVMFVGSMSIMGRNVTVVHPS